MKITTYILIALFGFGISTAQKELTAYVFIAEECPISIYMVSDLKKISEDYGQMCDFVLVFPMKKSTSQSAASFIKDYGLDNFEIELDTHQDIAKKYGAAVTPEIIIVNSSSENILYRGRINDAYFAPGRKRHTPLKRDASNAFEHIAENKSAPKPWNDAIGCFITFQ